MVEEVRVKYEGRVNVIGLVADLQERDGSPSNEKISFARELMDDAGASFTNILMSSNIASSVMGNISVVPTTFFTDSEGLLKGEFLSGARSLLQWSEIIDGKL